MLWRYTIYAHMQPKDTHVIIIKELGRVACTCHHNAWEMEPGRPGMQGHPQLLNEFKGSQSYTRSFIKNILLWEHSESETGRHWVFSSYADDCLVLDTPLYMWILFMYNNSHEPSLALRKGDERKTPKGTRGGEDPLQSVSSFLLLLLW